MRGAADPAADELWAKHPETKQPEPLATTQTNEVGNFSFPVAPPGVYDVAVRLASGQTISALFPGPSNKAQVVTVNGALMPSPAMPGLQTPV